MILGFNAPSIAPIIAPVSAHHLNMSMNSEKGNNGMDSLVKKRINAPMIENMKAARIMMIILSQVGTGWFNHCLNSSSDFLP